MTRSLYTQAVRRQRLSCKLLRGCCDVVEVLVPGNRLNAISAIAARPGCVGELEGGDREERFPCEADGKGLRQLYKSQRCRVGAKVLLDGIRMRSRRIGGDEG